MYPAKKMTQISIHSTTQNITIVSNLSVINLFTIGIVEIF